MKQLSVQLGNPDHNNNEAKGQTMSATLFEAIKAAGIPYASHYGDLYIPVTDQTRAILKQFPDIARPTVFTNQVEGGLWYDCPFAYLPYWESVNRKCEARRQQDGLRGTWTVSEEDNSTEIAMLKSAISGATGSQP